MADKTIFRIEMWSGDDLTRKKAKQELRKGIRHVLRSVEEKQKEDALERIAGMNIADEDREYLENLCLHFNLRLCPVI